MSVLLWAQSASKTSGAHLVPSVVLLSSLLSCRSRAISSIPDSNVTSWAKAAVLL